MMPSRDRSRFVEAFRVEADAGTDRRGHPGQVLLQYGSAHQLPRALDGRRVE
jgi:hypothetical protein